MEYPKLSIIIACYNDPAVLTAIKFAREQTYPNKEIIVVDDGSEQATQEIIDTVKGEIDILIRRENSGQSIARNEGIKNANGTYILNWDSDDYFEPEFAEKAIQKFKENEAVKIVTCLARRFDKHGTIDIFTPRGGQLKNFLFKNSALGSSMFKKSDWEACGGYEEILPILGMEDWEFYIQLLKNGGTAYVIPEVLFHYQIRENSTTAQIKDVKQEKFRHIVLKHKKEYRENFEDLVNELFRRIEQGKKEKIKIARSWDQKIGKVMLAPVRLFKSLLTTLPLFKGRKNA